MSGNSPLFETGKSGTAPHSLPDLAQGGHIVPILAGGGTRLPAHVGVLTALHDLGATFSHLVGVSGGSIVGSLFAAGRSLHDIKQLSVDIDFTQFKGFSHFNLFYRGGLSSGKHFESWLSAIFHGNSVAVHVRTLGRQVAGGWQHPLGRRPVPGLGGPGDLNCFFPVMQQTRRETPGDQ